MTKSTKEKWVTATYTWNEFLNLISQVHQEINRNKRYQKKLAKLKNSKLNEPNRSN